MGKFAALDDPVVDNTIEVHLQWIVMAIGSQMEPRAIILRGSFGWGEGSDMIQDGQLRCLGEYEVSVATLEYLG